MAEKNIARDGLIVAVGGGAFGDLRAFIASTYQWGIDQVNLIGFYYNPKAIFMNLNFLFILSERDYYSGICELI